MTDTWARERAEQIWQTLRFGEISDLPKLAAALREAEHLVLARLQSPDEAMIEAICHCDPDDPRGYILKRFAALAAVLSAPPQEEG